jgi:hypothetical protein
MSLSSAKAARHGQLVREAVDVGVQQLSHQLPDLGRLPFVVDSERGTQRVADPGFDVGGLDPPPTAQCLQVGFNFPGTVDHVGNLRRERSSVAARSAPPTAGQRPGIVSGGF